MNIKTLNVSLLSFSIITALFPLNAMATKLTIEQRLELLENELSQNKQELKATQNELGVYKSRLSTLQKSITENKYKSASLAEISATSPVADNIKNENGEQNSSAAAHTINGSQQVAVIESKGDKTTIESVTLKDISKYILRMILGSAIRGTSAQAGVLVITAHHKLMQRVLWDVLVMR